MGREKTPQSRRSGHGGLSKRHCECSGRAARFQASAFIRATFGYRFDIGKSPSVCWPGQARDTRRDCGLTKNGSRRVFAFGENAIVRLPPAGTHPRLMRKPAKYWKTPRKDATQTDDWRCACSLVPRRVGEAPPLAGRAQMRPKNLPGLETDLEHGASRRDVR